MIPISQARALFTQSLVAVYKERVVATGFLRSFYKTREEITKYVSTETVRTSENKAKDVERNTEGNRNQFAKSTQNIWLPPYFREFSDITQLSLYDRFIGSTVPDQVLFAEFGKQVMDNLDEKRKLIERAYEFQCAEVFETGIITSEQAGNYDFKRKTASKVNLGAGNYWADAGVDPVVSIETGGNFLRKVGKSQGGTLNMILGSKALTDLISNEKVQKRADIKNFSLDLVSAPQKGALGMVFHGQISAGSYRVNLWTYPEYYDVNGVSTPYINDKKAILLPESPNFVFAFAAVPQLVTEGGGGLQRGAYIISEYKDERKASHIFDIQSAGMAIPVAVDQIYTMQVVA